MVCFLSSINYMCMYINGYKYSTIMSMEILKFATMEYDIDKSMELKKRTGTTKNDNGRQIS